MITALEAAQMQARMDAGKRKRTTPPADAVKHESDLHEQIRDECRRRGWLEFSSRWGMSTRRPSGEPDFSIRASGGRVFDIEVKNRLGKLTPAQQATAAHAAKLGHKIHVVRSFSEFLEVVK